MASTWRHTAALLTAVLALAAQEKAPRDYPDVLAEIEGQGAFAPLFPFRIARGAPDNITNVQTWSGAWRPAGESGFVRAEGARFVDDGGVRRFVGTNICFTGCFPEHAEAERVADDLARFGINLVRLHYVHHKFPPGRKYATPDSFVEPVQLERFDYLFHRLKQRGIHVYMQLNIARKFGQESGFENADKLPWYNNGIDNVEPRMIALQKKYVRDLLAHVNPYTKLAYKDEPAIAMLELANENSLVVNWYNGKLDSLPSPYAEQFQALWNDWLRAKYGTTAALRGAWECRNDPLGEEMIPDGTFPKAPADEANYPAWGLQHDGTSEGDWRIVPAAGAPLAAGSFARLAIRRIGKTPNMPQFFRRLGIVEGTQYNLSFKARVSRPSPVSVRVSQDHDPWRVCGFRTTFDASEQWREYSFAFQASMTDPHVRLVVANFAEGVTFEIGDISLRPGGPVGLGPDETLEDGTIPLPRPTGPSRYHLPAILADASDFLADREEVYFRQMYRCAREEAGARQPVTGTQLGYGFWYPMGRMDYCDIHSYWCHPAAPGGGSWTNPRMREFWFVRNLPMVAADPARATIGQLAVKRVLNRPYTVSEYDHPYPNFYAAEGNPMLFALGAFQDWGAIMHFAWTHSDDYGPQVLAGYFDMKANTVKQAHLPACHAMFARGDVRRGPGRFRYALPLSERQEREQHARQPGMPPRYQPPTTLMKADPALSLAVFAGLDLVDLAVPAPGQDAARISSWADLPETMGSPEKGWIRNEFGELYWRLGQDGFFTVDTPGTKLFTGFVRGRSFAFGGIAIAPGRTRLDWATVSLVKAQGAPAFRDRLTAGRYLLSATGLVQNTGTVLKQARPDAVSTASGYGGVGGNAPILCEGIPATLTLRADSAKVALFPLDQNGDRGTRIPAAGNGTEARLEIGPQHRTVWYELVVE